jgi:hypothetical protein
MTVYLLIGIALVSVVTGWFGRGHWDAGEIERTRAEVVAEKNAALLEAASEKKRADEIAGRFEDKLSKLRIVNRTINNEVRHETEKVVYGDPRCDLPASGVVLNDKSVREANRAAGYVQTEVPSAAAPATGQGRPGNDGRPLQP